MPVFYGREWGSLSKEFLRLGCGNPEGLVVREYGISWGWEGGLDLAER